MRTFRREGELWGETSDGVLVKWDGHESRWNFVAPEASTKVEETSVSQPSVDPNIYAVPHFGNEPRQDNGSETLARETSGGVATITGDPPYAEPNLHDPDHPINKWWNEKFPPFSWRRWAFGVAVLPFIGAVIELYRHFSEGKDLSLGRYLFAVLGGWGILTIVFVFGRRRARGLKPRSLTNHLLDLGASIVILFLGFAVGDVVLTTGVDTFSLLLSLGLAALVAVIIHFRLYGLAVAVVVAAGGALVAFFLHLFSLLWGQESSFWEIWLTISGLGVICAIPFTIQLHRQTKALAGIPTYSIATVISGMLIFATLFIGIFESPEEVATEVKAPSSQTQQAATARPPVSKLQGAKTRELAGRQLYEAWRASSVPTAEAVARENVVAELFLIRYSGQPFKGCGNYQIVYNVCVIETSNDLLLLGTDMASDQNGGQFFYIQFMLHVPLGSEVAYFPAASPNPS